MAQTSPERHLSTRSNWLRAAVLGANDGLVSVASLVLGIAASGASSGALVVAGVAGLSAGALSMAAGELVSVSSQRDSEKADIALERAELARHPREEQEELAGIYRERGLPDDLAEQVAEALSERDALAAHVRDELGLSDERVARPVQAALASAAAFVAGAIVPVITIAAFSADVRVWLTVVATLVALAGLGAAGARLGGAHPVPAAARVAVWGGAAMAVTAAIGGLVGTSV